MDMTLKEAVEYLTWYFMCDDGMADQTAVEAWLTIEDDLRQVTGNTKKLIDRMKNLPNTIYHENYYLRISHDLRDEVVRTLKAQQRITDQLNKKEEK